VTGGHAREPSLLHQEAGRLAVLVTMALVAIFLGMGAPQQVLAPICTKYVYANGWTCFLLWLIAAIVARPARASGSTWIRAALHGIAWAAAWIWWLLAVFLSDLISRADLLFVSYVCIGVFLICWRSVLHKAALRALTRRAFAESSYAPGVITFLGAAPVDSLVQPASAPDRVLARLGRILNYHHIATAHRFIFGPRGPSNIIQLEAMNNTDLRCGALRDALRDWDSGFSPDLARQTAIDLARAFRCEVEVWLTTRPHTTEEPIGTAIQARALCIYALLSLAVVRRAIQRSEDMEAALTVLTANGAFPTLALKLVRDADGAQLGDIERIMLESESLETLDLAPYSIGRLSLAVALCRFRLYKLARGVLSNSRREASQRPENEALRRAHMTLDALRAELELESKATAGAERPEMPWSDADRQLLEERTRKCAAAVQSGEHPRSGAVVTPSQFARLPQPHRAREIGVGLLGGVLAVVIWLLFLPLPFSRPIPGRLQTVFDVPFGGRILSDGIRSATVATTDGSPTILLADPKAGVKTLDVETLRADSEGGAGTDLDGEVLKLASNSDGSAFAVFQGLATTGSDGSLCLSSRDRAGFWHLRIPPAKLDVTGEELEAALYGHSEPLFLRRTGANRLLRYSETQRSLVEATTDGQLEIQGSFVDSAESSAATKFKTIILLTTLADGKRQVLYSLTEREKGLPIQVSAVELPSLSQRTLVAVCLTNTGAIVALDSDGGAWRTKGSGDTETVAWERLRAGRQDIQLDKIDLAIVTGDGKRLWFIREGSVWTRSLEEEAKDGLISLGWASSPLPQRTLATSSLRDRWQLFDPLVDGSGVYLLAPSGEAEKGGSVLRLTTQRQHQVIDGSSAEVIEPVELLTGTESLLDADAIQGDGVLAIIEQPKDQSGTQFLRIDRLGSGTRTIRRSPIASEEFSLRGLAGVGAFGAAMIALDSSGRFVRFDAQRDLLLDGHAPAGRFVGQINLPLDPPPLDTAISVTPEGGTAYVLNESGSVVDYQLIDGASGTLRVIPAQRPSSDLLSPRFVFSGTRGATIFGSQQVWQFDALNAGSHFINRSTDLGNSPTDPILTMSGRAGPSPALAWLSDEGRLLRTFSNGTFTSLPINTQLRQLRTGFGGSLFAFDTEDRLVSVSLDTQPIELLRPQRGGPGNRVEHSAIRAGFIDFLTDSRLHSIRRKDASWSSVDLNGRYQVESISRGRSVLVPRDRGPAYYLAGNAAADEGVWLRKAGDMKHARVLGEGVIGMAKDGPAWVRFDDTATLLSSRIIEKGDLDRVTEVFEHSGDLLLRGSATQSAGKAQADRIMRYSLGLAARVWDPPQGSGNLRSVELTGNWLYALTDQSLFRLAAQDLNLTADFSKELPPGKRVLGGCDEPTDRPSLLSERGIYSIEPFGIKPLLLAPDVDGTTDPEIAWATASNDEITLFTNNGTWKRSADPTKPFAKVAHIPSPIKLAILSPNGGTWARTEEGWTSVEHGTREGKGIGWTANGQLITDRLGRPLLAGQPIRGFEGLTPHERNIGGLIGFEPLGSALTLLVGENGNRLFDTLSREFPPTDPDLQDWNIKAVSRSPFGLLARNGDGNVALIDAESANVLFRNQPVRQLLAEHGPLAVTTDGALLDAAGNAVLNTPPAVRGWEISTIGAVSIGSILYRADNEGRIDSIDTRTFEFNPVDSYLREGLKADAITKADGMLLAFDASRSHLFMPLVPEKRWRVAGPIWFAGRNSVAYVNAEAGGSLAVLPMNSQLSHPAAEHLPGTIKGNLANTTVAAIERSEGGVVLFDLLTGATKSAVYTDPDCFVDGDTLWSKVNGKIIRTDRAGVEQQTRQFNYACATPTKDGVRAFGLEILDANVQLIEIEPNTLTDAKTTTYTPRLPTLVATEGNPIGKVYIDASTQLIIARDQLALDDGKTVTLHPNPLKESKLRLFRLFNQYFVDGPNGTRIVVLTKRDGAYQFPPASRDEEGLEGMVSRLLYRVARQTIPVTEVADLISLSCGTLDTKSGWIIEEQPIRLLQNQAGIEVMFRGNRSEQINGTSPLLAKDKLVAPLSLEDGSIHAMLNGRKVELGPPLVGLRMKAHQVRAVAPIESGTAPHVTTVGLAWIDAAGQLWTRGGTATACVDTGSKLERFGVDEGGRLYAIGTQQVVRISGHASLVAEPPREGLLEDCRQIPGQSGWLRWRLASTSGKFLDWQITYPDGNQPLKPCVGGFDLISGAQLGTIGESVCLVLRQQPPLTVPILNRGQHWQVDWSSPPSRVQFSEPRPLQAPSTRVENNGRSILQLDESGATFLLAGESFRFIPALGCFECNVVKAASTIDGKLVTLLGNNKLASWNLIGDRATSATFLPNPPEAHTDVMWNSLVGDLCIARAPTAEGASHWRFVNGAWQAETTARFGSTRGARWQWTPNTRRLNLGTIAYDFVPGRWPQLDFEYLDLTAAPRTVAGGSILFRAQGEQWYSLQDGLPERTSTLPSPRDAEIIIGQLRISRLPNLSCTLGDAPITLRIDDGIIPDIDRWRFDAPIIPLAPDMALVPVGRGDFFRRLRIESGRMQLLGPERDANARPSPLPRADKDGAVKLRDDHTLLVNRAELGVPSADGYPQLSPAYVVPLLHQPEGKLKLAASGRLYTLSPGTTANLLDSIDDEGEARDVTHAGWVIENDMIPKFLMFRRDGMHLMQTPEGFIQSPVAMPTDSSVVVRDTSNADSFMAQLLTDRIRLTKPGYEINLVKDQDHTIIPEHTRASRITASGNGFTTWSAAWMAQYAVEGDACILQSVRAATDEQLGELLVPRPLEGNLFVHRNLTIPSWNIGVSPVDPELVWPFDALRSLPSRVYVAGADSSLEVGGTWQRISDSRGAVTQRSVSQKTHPLAGSTAQRRSSHVVTPTGSFRTSEVQPVHEQAVLPEAGALPHRQSGKWSISLERSGAGLVVSYGGVDLSVSDGSLPNDYAVAAGQGRFNAWMVDRLSLVSLARDYAPRLVHEPGTRAVLAAHNPARVTYHGKNSQPNRLINVQPDEHSLGFLLPDHEGLALQKATPGMSYSSWTQGAKLDVRFETSGKVEFRRINTSHQWSTYPLVDKNEACMGGRFAFDSPRDLIRARHPKRGTIEACVALKAGWEWPEEQEGGVEFVVEPPTEVPPEYGPVLHPDWLLGSDLDENSATPEPSESGNPIIWFPYEDRLFLVGERNVMWVELDKRWRGRTVNSNRVGLESR
jgi:hypothetical protein